MNDLELIKLLRKVYLTPGSKSAGSSSMMGICGCGGRGVRIQIWVGGRYGQKSLGGQRPQ